MHGPRLQCSRSMAGTRFRLPRARLSKAVDQLHLVGQSQGRDAATTCSRADFSASTTSARSTARRCSRRRCTGAVGRHRLDGEVLPQHAGDGAAARQPRAYLRRCRAEVLRAFRSDRRRHERAMGRDRTSFFYDRLRKSRRLTYHGARAFDGRDCCRYSRQCSSMRRCGSNCRMFRTRAQLVRQKQAWRFREFLHVLPEGSAPWADLRWWIRRACGACLRACLTRANFYRPTDCDLCRATTANIRSSSTWPAGDSASRL